MRYLWIAPDTAAFQLSVYTIRKAKRDAGPKHVRTVGDRKFRQLHRLSGQIYVVGGFFRSFYVDDGIFRRPGSASRSAHELSGL
jgi:hypothetical protein